MFDPEMVAVDTNYRIYIHLFTINLVNFGITILTIAPCSDGLEGQKWAQKRGHD